jgi:hypothetical protein
VRDWFLFVHLVPIQSSDGGVGSHARPFLFRRQRSKRPARILKSALALQLRFLRSSESIGHHDSEIVDDGYFD